MRILVVNDDGYQAKGLGCLARMMRTYGEVTVIAPRYHQSGMSMAVNLGGFEMKAGREPSGVMWLDGSPTSCVKFALNTIFADKYPDLLVSGVNHGSNAATASLYSGTLGAAAEGVLNRIPSIGVSLNDPGPDPDFSLVEELFPGIFERLLSNMPSPSERVYMNVNFPAVPRDKVKGIRVCDMGFVRWVREFNRIGEDLYIMKGEIEDDSLNSPIADHHLLEQGYITIVPHKLDSTDYAVAARLRAIFEQ